MSHRIIALLLALSLALAVSAGGCGSSEPVAATRPDAPPEEVGPPEVPALEPSLPAWRLVDRTALAASLGWGEVTRGNTASMQVALTFDAGADGAPTPAILDALAAAGVKSTFFLTGQFADAYPLTVQRIAAEGHELANHSYTHPQFPELAPPEVVSQIERTEARIMELTGLTQPGSHPPGQRGGLSERLLDRRRAGLGARPFPGLGAAARRLAGGTRRHRLNALWLAARGPDIADDNRTAPIGRIRVGDPYRAALPLRREAGRVTGAGRRG